MILGFIVSILVLTVMVVGLIMPRYFDVLIPAIRRDEGTDETVVNQDKVPDEEPAAVIEVDQPKKSLMKRFKGENA